MSIKRKAYQNSFSARYNLNRLVYYEEHARYTEALNREYQMKKWNRQWKIELIESFNPNWEDLSEGWYD